MKLPCSKRSRAGFTLVELLVVIGIIALLISILLPSLNRARAAAQATVCLSNMRQMGIGAQFFSNDHEGWTIKGWENSGPYLDANMGGAAAEQKSSGANQWQWTFDNGAQMWGWDSVLYTYMETKDIFRCPGDSSDKFRGMWNNNRTNMSKEPEWDDIPASYRHNASHGPWVRYSFKKTKLTDPTKAILLFESNPEDIRLHHTTTIFPDPASNVHPLYPHLAASFRHGSDQETGGNLKDPDFYNKRRLNYLFHDGHAAAVTWGETWEPQSEPAVEGSDRHQITMWRQIYLPNPWKELMPNAEPSTGVWDE